MYFTIKDSDAQMPCVMFRSDTWRVNAPLSNGHAVIVHGRVSLWQSAGKLQLYVDMVQPEGVGRLELEFQALKAKLEAEGLFDVGRKRPLPRFPSAIGIVTSPQAAALQDILNVLRRRYPLAEVVLSPTLVQGDGAGQQIAAAIRRLYTSARVDVVIVARGGGSTEELWAFNEECVARAIFACPVPVISGVGHEVDYTIADYVADLRAPTPSAAAELVAPSILELRDGVRAAQESLDERLDVLVQSLRADLDRTKYHLARVSPAHAIADYRDRLRYVTSAAGQRMGHELELRRSALGGRLQQLEALNPSSVLRRGYASVSRPDGTPVPRASCLASGDETITTFADGAARSTVRTVHGSDGGSEP